MCIVIDTNVFSSVFNKENVHHKDYAPVLKWIWDGPGFVVYGGSKYLTELSNAGYYYCGILIELKKKGRAKVVDRAQVDAHQTKVERTVNTARCNDAHLIAIFRVSGCRLLCTNDRRSDKFIKNKAYYLPRQKRPSIYRTYDHRRLLCPQNIVQIRHAT